MIPLPLDRLPVFEAKLEQCWSGRSRGISKRRDALAIGLGLCGLRWKEVSKAQRCDLGGVSMTLAVRSAKGGVRRTIRVGQSWFAAMMEVFADRPSRLQRPSGKLFVTSSGEPLGYMQVYRRCRQWTRLIFKQPYSFHCLRHTAAARCYRQTGDVLAVQKLLGHRSLRWTAEYLRGIEPVAAGALPGFVEGPAVLRLYDPAGLADRGRPGVA